MEIANSSVVRLELPPEAVALLEAIADKQGLPKEEVAREAVQIWLEQYRTFGPAFSRL